MEYIEALFNIAKDNQLLVFIIGVLATFIESFIPALPLVGIVAMNATLLGFVQGVTASTIGSCLGTIALFLVASKFSYIKYIEDAKNEKTEKITKWVKNQNYIVIYLCYASAFIPSCLVSISAGLSNMDARRFIPGMILGKITMFSIASYVGYDLEGVLINPKKIVILVLIIIISFLIGKKITDKMSNTSKK